MFDNPHYSSDTRGAQGDAPIPMNDGTLEGLVEHPTSTEENPGPA